MMGMMDNRGGHLGNDDSEDGQQVIVNYLDDDGDFDADDDEEGIWMMRPKGKFPL